MGQCLVVRQARSRVTSNHSQGALIREEVWELLERSVECVVVCRSQAGNLIGSIATPRPLCEEIENRLGVMVVFPFDDATGRHDSAAEQALVVTIVQNKVGADRHGPSAFSENSHLLEVTTELS